MVKKGLVLAALLGLVALAPQSARADAYYVAVATWTLGGSATKALAFQNTSSTLDVEIVKIELSHAHSGSAITGGLAQFWVYASTSMTHGGTSQTLGHSPKAANVAKPSHISLSTGPVTVVYENNSAAKGALPLLQPLIVSSEETAAANFYDSWAAPIIKDGLLSESILLPAGANRGIVVEQQNMAATSVTAGVVQARIHYIVK